MKMKTYEVLTDNKLLYLPMALVNQIFRLLITSSRKRRLQRQFLELLDFFREFVFLREIFSIKYIFVDNFFIEKFDKDNTSREFLLTFNVIMRLVIYLWLLGDKIFCNWLQAVQCEGCSANFPSFFTSLTLSWLSFSVYCFVYSL
jgi:hypothetical protein